MTHPNKDILIAFANGEEIEWRYKKEEWCSSQRWVASMLVYPEEYPDYSFRIKPKKVMIRHADTQAGVLVFMKNYNKYEDEQTAKYEAKRDIVWLDEWHEASFGPAGE